MKLSTLFLLIATLQVMATGYSQTVSLNLNMSKTSVRELLKEIERQTELSFIFSDDISSLNDEVSVNVHDRNVKDVLYQVFKDTDLDYQILNEKLIVIAPKDALQAITVTGKVTEVNGEPLPGVSVAIKGVPQGTATDVNGDFTLQVPGENVTLVFSYIGFISQEILVGNKRNINIELLEDTRQIEEVVVVGYGTQKKVNLTGSVSQIKMDDVLGNRPVSSVANTLLGNVPGLVFNRFSGEPGSQYHIAIRGISSINGSDPLILVDNVPMDMAYVNPEDIESISVLKDASASAIYGARAAFGVILITTKKSEKDKPNKFSYSTKISFSNPQEIAKRASPLRTVQAMKDAGWVNLWAAGEDIDTWIELLKEYNANPSLYPEGYTKVGGVPYKLKETDVTRDMLETGIQQIHDFSVTGGSNKSSYRVSLGMLDNDGILVTNKDRYTRYTVSTFLNTDISKWMTTQISLLYTDSKKSDPSAYSMSYDVFESTLFQPSFYPTGGIDIDDKYHLFETPRNIIGVAIPDINKRNQMNLLGRVILTPLEGLNITGEYSINNAFYSTTQYRKPIKDFYDGFAFTNVPSRNITQSIYTDRKSKTIYNVMNVFATYNKNLQNHNITLMAGINTEHSDYETLTAKRIEMINDELPSIGQGVGLLTAEDDFSEFALFGTFYRLNYAFMDKYLFETSGRYDGSSKFPKKDRFGFFPSFSVGWRVSEESFMKFSRNVVSNLKLRASWGSIGNQNIDPFQYMPGMTAYLSGWVREEERPTSLQPPALVRSNFTWEEVQTINFGVNLGLFHQKLDTSFDVFKRKTLNMLARGMDYPLIIGATAPLQNAADMETKGWELQMSWRDKAGSVVYRLGFNISDNRSTITKFANDTKVLTNYYVGQVLGEIWGYETDRLYTVDDFVDGTLQTTAAGALTGGTLKPGIAKYRGSNPNPGDVLYKNPDENGDVWTGASNTADDPGSRRIIGNSSPRYIYGIHADASWKGFELSILLQGTGKRQVWLNNSTIFPYTENYFVNIYEHQTDYWTPDNTNAFFSRIYRSALYNTGANHQVQTKYLQNAAYLDIKSVVLSYNLPKSLISKINFNKTTLFVNGENVWSFNHYTKGTHPDNTIRGNGATYPYMRMITAGLNISF